MIKSCGFNNSHPPGEMIMEPVTMMISKKPSESPIEPKLSCQVGPKNHQLYVGAHNSTFCGGEISLSYPLIFGHLQGATYVTPSITGGFLGPPCPHDLYSSRQTGSHPTKLSEPPPPSSHAYTPEIYWVVVSNIFSPLLGEMIHDPI